MTSSKLKPRSRSDEVQGPDGGWGWVLVAAMFISTSLVFGLMRSLGIFFVEFVQYFEESAQAISWISSIGLAAQQFFSESLLLKRLRVEMRIAAKRDPKYSSQAETRVPVEHICVCWIIQAIVYDLTDTFLFTIQSSQQIFQNSVCK